jgi:hypothetical protein
MSTELIIFIVLVVLRFVFPNLKKTFKEETRKQQPQKKPQLAEDTYSIESIKEEIRKMRAERAAPIKKSASPHDQSPAHAKPQKQPKQSVIVKTPAVATKRVDKTLRTTAIQPKRYFTPKPLLKSKAVTKYAASQSTDTLAATYELSNQSEVTACQLLKLRLSNLRESILIKEVLDVPVCKRPLRKYNFGIVN